MSSASPTPDESEEKNEGSPNPAAQPPEGEDSSLDPPSWLDEVLMARAMGVPRVTLRDLRPAAGRGENYASVVYKCTVLVPRAGDGGDGGEAEEERPVVIKCLPANPFRQMFSNKAEVFRKERDMYTKILPRYEAMLSKTQPGRKSFPWPEHYNSEVDGQRDYVVLKDLGTQGFSMAQRMKGFDGDHLALVLSALGEMHACSVALEHVSSPEDFKADVTTPFRDLMFTDDEGMMKFVEKTVEATAETVLAWGGRFENIGQWIKEWMSVVFSEMKDLLKPAPGALLCHGDAWLNNMLFRYDGSQGIAGRKPTEVKLLDFQVSRYASPATDLLYTMVTSTTAATRKEHWDHLLEHQYLNTFWKTLESLGVKEKIRGGIYSMEWLRRELKRHVRWALLNAALVLRIVVLESKYAPDLDKLTEKDLDVNMEMFKGHDDRLYQERLRELICEFSEDGLFDS